MAQTVVRTVSGSVHQLSLNVESIVAPLSMLDVNRDRTGRFGVGLILILDGVRVFARGGADPVRQTLPFLVWLKTANEIAKIQFVARKRNAKQNRYIAV